MRLLRRGLKKYQFSLFPNDPPLKKVWPFIWSTLKSLKPRMLSAQFAWNWPSGSEQEVVNFSIRRTGVRKDETYFSIDREVLKLQHHFNVLNVQPRKIIVRRHTHPYVFIQLSLNMKVWNKKWEKITIKAYITHTYNYTCIYLPKIYFSFVFRVFEDDQINGEF